MVHQENRAPAINYEFGIDLTCSLFIMKHVKLLSMQQIDPENLKAKIDKNQAPFMLDVRTPEEWDICRIEGSVLIPMNEIQSRLDEIPEETEIVVICHHGIRSAQVLSALAHYFEYDLENLYNLRGGIDLYSIEADETIPRY